MIVSPKRSSTSSRGLDETDQRIGVTPIRRLARGAPVTIADLAASANLPEADIAEGMERMPGVYRDDQERVVCYFGVALRQVRGPDDRVVHPDCLSGCAYQELVTNPLEYMDG